MANAHEVDRMFVGTFAVLQLAMIIIYMFSVDYGEDSFANSTTANGRTIGGKVGTVEGTYSYYTDVAVMIFIGFGFLMTFLKKYAFSALGYTFLISCFVIEMVILCEGLFEEIDAGFHSKIMLNISSLVRGLFASGAVMISFGAVLGRTTPKQLLLMAFLEVWVYCINEYIGAGKLKAVDMGGSMFVHEFGAYFGLAVAWALNHKRNSRKEMVDMKNESNASRYDSDVSAMIGTLFLWILWPSFNGALAPTPDAKMRVVINTVLSLCGSCVAAFVVSHLTKKGKFDMVHIQNATLAGGVAVGSSSDLLVGPGGSMMIGTIAGVISVLGYVWVSPQLERKIGLQDTCGVHNLHGLPGLMGAITGAITCATAKDTIYGVSYESLFSEGRTPANQWTYQLAAMIVTFGMALAGGLLTGFLMNLLEKKPVKSGNMFSDSDYWEAEGDVEEHLCVEESHELANA